jgi:hypothetical protein
MNVSDILVITLSAYVFIWGVNYALRQANMAGYQA